MTHEHEVTRLVPAIVNGMMVDMTQHGSGADPGEERRGEGRGGEGEGRGVQIIAQN